MDALYLDRPRLQTLLFRFVRDVSEHRKPIPVLLRRGLASGSEPALRAHAPAYGCRPVGFGEALGVVRGTRVSARRPRRPAPRPAPRRRLRRPGQDGHPASAGALRTAGTTKTPGIPRPETNALPSQPAEGRGEDQRAHERRRRHADPVG